MGDIVTTIFSTFNEVIAGLGNGIKTAFTTILWQDPEASTKVLSDPVKFGMICGGIALATGLVMGAFRFARNRRG